VLAYDIFVRDGLKGDWAAWLSGVTYTSAEFNGTPGHTYFFRSQAHDIANHTQVWQPNPQASVTFYAATLAVRASDGRGNQLPAPALTLAPAAVFLEAGQAPFEKRFGLASPVKVSATAPGFGSVPDTLLNASGDATFTFVLPPADDRVTNGGFETGSLNAWEVTGGGASISTTLHTGQYAAKRTPAPGGASAFSQAITVDVVLQQPTLSFLYYLPENASGDEFSVKVNGDTELAVLSTISPTAGWTHAWADLSAFSGQTVTLSFQISGTGAAVYIDEVTLGSWSAPQMESVSPTTWQANQPQTITITGQNFASLAQVFLNNIPLTNFIWINSTQLSVQTPPGLLGGYYHLRVVNPDGAENALGEALALAPLPNYLPTITRSNPAPTSVTPSDWLTLGYDDHHSGYSPNEAGGSRYTQVWSARPIVQTNYQPVKQVVAADGVVIFVQDGPFVESGVFAYQMDTGRELWHYSFTGKWSLNPASIANGMVYFQENNVSNGGNSDSFLFCLDLYTGQKLWQAPFLDQWDRYLHPLVVGQNIYIEGGGDGQILIFNAAEGDYVGGLGIYDLHDSTPSYADGNIYTRIDAYFYELDSTNANINWKLLLGGNWGGTYNTSTVIANRTAFVTGPQGFYAINLDTHLLSWSIPGNYDLTLPAVVDDTVYAIVGSVLEARQVSTGKLLGSFTAPSTLLNAPVVTPSLIFVATASATYMLDRTTLQVKWSTPEGGWLTVADGYLFIANANGYVTAYRAQEP